MIAVLDDKHIDAIMASLMHGIITFDGSGHVIMANKAAENLFLVREGGLEGKTMLGIGDNDILAMIEEVLKRGNEMCIRDRYYHGINSPAFQTQSIYALDY